MRNYGEYEITIDPSQNFSLDTLLATPPALEPVTLPSLRPHTSDAIKIIGLDGSFRLNQDFQLGLVQDTPLLDTFYEDEGMRRARRAREQSSCAKVKRALLSLESRRRGVVSNFGEMETSQEIEAREMQEDKERWTAEGVRQREEAEVYRREMLEEQRELKEDAERQGREEEERRRKEAEASDKRGKDGQMFEIESLEREVDESRRSGEDEQPKSGGMVAARGGESQSQPQLHREAGIRSSNEEVDAKEAHDFQHGETPTRTSTEAADEPQKKGSKRPSTRTTKDTSKDASADASQRSSGSPSGEYTEQMSEESSTQESSESQRDRAMDEAAKAHEECNITTSCKDVFLDRRHMLKALCKTRDGRWLEDTLNMNSLISFDGQKLSWGGGRGFLRHARRAWGSATSISAECRVGRRWQVLSLDDVSEHILNDNGKLVFSQEPIRWGEWTGWPQKVFNRVTSVTHSFRERFW